MSNTDEGFKGFCAEQAVLIGTLADCGKHLAGYTDTMMATLRLAYIQGVLDAQNRELARIEAERRALGVA